MTDRQVGNAKDMLQFIGDIIEGRMLGALYYFFWLNVRLALLIGFLLVVTHFIIKNYKFTSQISLLIISLFVWFSSWPCPRGHQKARKSAFSSALQTSNCSLACALDGRKMQSLGREDLPEKTWQRLGVRP